MPRKPLVTKPRIWKKHHKRPPIEDWMVEELEKSYNSWEYFIQNYVTIMNNKTGELSLFDPYEYQWKMLRHLDDGFGSIFLLPRQVGKALALDTQLPTPDGWTTIGEVSVGDYVIGKNGHPVRVLYKSPIHYRPTYKIVFGSGEEIVCCEDHLWVVGIEDEIKPTKNLTTKDVIYRHNGDEILIKSIEQIETRPTQCISVDADDHMFLCGKSMIPTHNTTVITAYLVWFAIFHPDKSIGVISKDANAAKDVIDRTKTVIEYLPHFMVPNVTRWNVKDIGFDNGSTIEAKAATKTSFRGESLSILYFDEMAFILNNIEDSLWNSIFPAMTAGGEEGMSRRKLIITSTPNGSENLFARLYFSAERAGDDALLRPLHIKNEEIPGREPGSDFEKKILASGVMTREQFEQEYYCSFTVSNKPTLIKYDIIEQLKPTKPYRRTSYGDFYYHSSHLSGRDVLLVSDVSEGVGQDYSTIVGFDLTTFDQIFEFSNNQMNIRDLAEQIMMVVKLFSQWTGKEVYYTIESNSVGLGVLSLIDAAEDEEFERAAYLVSEPGKKGFRMTQKTKARGCATLKHLVETNNLRLKTRAIISEARFFIKQGSTFKAQQGKNDDLMMSAVLACLAIERIAQWDDAVHKKLTSRGMILSQYADIDIGTAIEEEKEMPVLSSATISDDEELEIV